MLKKRDSVAIGSVGKYLDQSAKELVYKKKILDQHINSIINDYKGVDASKIINSFLDASSKLDKIIKTIEYYAFYMMALSNYDMKNIESAVDDLEKMMDEQLLLEDSDIIDDSIKFREVKDVKYYDK